MSDAFHRISVERMPDGGAVVRHTTNDDNDDGWDDGETVSWADTWSGPQGFDLACKNAGKSRVGISGVVVTVTVNGEQV